jgi:hypothetical protein
MGETGSLRIMSAPILVLNGRYQNSVWAPHCSENELSSFNKFNVIKKLALKVVTFCEIPGRFCHICGSIMAMTDFEYAR